MASFAERKSLLRAIEKVRDSVVLVYVTGDRRQLETQVSPEVIDIFVEHLDAVGPTKRITLILHTGGGHTAAAWRLTNLLHTFCDSFEVIVPSKALSAGTLIALGADRIIMTKQAALGPIDPSVNHPLAPVVPNAPNVRAPVSVEAVRGYLDAATELGITDGPSRASILIDLSKQVHPLVLGEIFRSRSQIRFLAKKLLKRQVPDDAKSKPIIDFLCAESGSHDYTINRREARELGLQIENPDDRLYDLLRKLHRSFVEELKLLEPYDPAAMLGTNPAVQYTLPRAVIESLKTGCHEFLSSGTLTSVQAPGPMGISQAIHDQRTFEGWRKVA